MNERQCNYITKYRGDIDFMQNARDLAKDGKLLHIYIYIEMVATDVLELL